MPLTALALARTVGPEETRDGVRGLVDVADEQRATIAPEIARLRAIIEQAVEQLCLLAEAEQEVGHDETADRIWSIANEYLEIQVQHGR